MPTDAPEPVDYDPFGELDEMLARAKEIAKKHELLGEDGEDEVGVVLELVERAVELRQMEQKAVLAAGQRHLFHEVAGMFAPFITRQGDPPGGEEPDVPGYGGTRIEPG